MRGRGEIAGQLARFVLAEPECVPEPKIVRGEIVSRLAAAIRDPQSQRTVHFAFADTAMPDMRELDDVFTETLRRVYRLG